MAIQSTIRHRFYKNDGTLNAGGKVYTYLPGTSTLTATYTDSTAGTPNANPIILDSKGEGAIWQTAKIKVNVLESDNTQVTGYPVDYVGYLVMADDIHAATNKTTPVNADEIGIWDSVSQLLNRVTFANIWVWIQAKLAAPGAIGGTTPSTGGFTTLNSTGGALNGTLGATTPSTIAATSVAATSITATGPVTTTGHFRSSNSTGAAGTGGVGYTGGAGGSVTQLTSKGTGVTLDKVCGAITLNNASLAAYPGVVSFTLTNSAITTNDTIVVNIKSTVGTIGAYVVQATSGVSGSTVISVRNLTAGALAEAIIINFAVLTAAIT